MENNKLGKKIRDWAISLGFRLPDGSTPSADYFALLTLTPHRRQLWEAVVESIQPRQKVEHMRKQILVAKLLDEKKFAKSNSMRVTDRKELWCKQNILEDEIKEKNNAVNKLEKNNMVKASDLLFEICTLAELEKQFEELEEKSLVFKLILKREKKALETLERSFFKESTVLSQQNSLDNCVRKENVGHFVNELLCVEECKCTLDEIHCCKTLNKFDELCKFETTEKFVWEEVIRLKKNWLKEFSAVVEKLISTEKNILCEKEEQIERNMNFSIIKLKQRMTEKSQLIIMNSIEEKFLNSEIEKLEEKLLGEPSQDQILNEGGSFLSLDETSEENVKMLKNLKKNLNVMSLKSYLEFLKEKLKQLEEATEVKRQDQWKEFKDGEEGLQLTLKAFEFVVDEINSLKLEGKKVEMEIIRLHNKLQALEQILKEEVERKSESRGVEIAAHKLKLASEKRIEILSETPIAAFRTVENLSAKVMFECESAAHCLRNYGGEFKQFFSAMLIPPIDDLKKIFSQVSKRQGVINKVKKFIEEREKLTTLQRKIDAELNSITYDSRLIEKNFKDSDGILWNIFSKTDGLLKETDFIGKILKNWVEQPYRLMIKDTPEGKNLKEIEEQKRKKRVVTS